MKTSTKVWLGITGFLLVVTGCMCIAQPGETIMSLAWLAGIITLFSGISTLLSWIRLHFILPRSGQLLLSSVLQIVLGIVMLSHKFIFATAFIYIFIGFLIVEGVNITLASFDFKKVGFRSWLLMFIFGICTLGLGIYSCTRPITAGETLSYIIGAAIIAYGLFFIFALYGIGRFEKRFDRLR